MLHCRHSTGLQLLLIEYRQSVSSIPHRFLNEAPIRLIGIGLKHCERTRTASDY